MYLYTHTHTVNVTKLNAIDLIYTSSNIIFMCEKALRELDHFHCSNNKALIVLIVCFSRC